MVVVVHALLDRERIDEPPASYLHRVGEVFATFGRDTQDSGNVSYGVRIGDENYFVKTAGDPDDSEPYLGHADRVALLRNAARLADSVRHPSLPLLHQTIESDGHGPMLVYAWVPGELLGGARREDEESAFQRFRRLPVGEVCRCLDTVYEVHELLTGAGWVACDFYDGSLIYHFAGRRLFLVDLDSYYRGPFRNRMGRMFGSTRFMAPEEFELGAWIDQRTTVFTMGRSALVLLGDGTLNRSAFRGSPALFDVVAIACQPEPGTRHASVAEFTSAWRAARSA